MINSGSDIHYVWRYIAKLEKEQQNEVERNFKSKTFFGYRMFTLGRAVPHDQVVLAATYWLHIKSECYQRSNIWWQQVKNQFRSYSYVR